MTKVLVLMSCVLGTFYVQAANAELYQQKTTPTVLLRQEPELKANVLRWIEVFPHKLYLLKTTKGNYEFRFDPVTLGFSVHKHSDAFVTTLFLQDVWHQKEDHLEVTDIAAPGKAFDEIIELLDHFSSSGGTVDPDRIIHSSESTEHSRFILDSHLNEGARRFDQFFLGVVIVLVVAVIVVPKTS